MTDNTLLERLEDVINRRSNLQIKKDQAIVEVKEIINEYNGKPEPVEVIEESRFRQTALF